MCQQLAHLAVLDGAHNEELSQMASCGNWGQASGNCHRDFLSTFCKDNGVTIAFEIEIPVRDPKTGKNGRETASLFLPHQLFADLAISYPDQFDQMFATGDCKSFWKNVEAVGDQRLQGHPICLDKRTGFAQKHVVDAHRTIPLFMHADGVEFQTRDSILCWSWGGLLPQYNSLATNMLCCAVPKTCTIESTWQPLMKYIKWSLESLQDGTHPSVGPDNEPLPKGSWLEKMAGQPLTPQNFRAVIWSIQGDREMFSNIIKLPIGDQSFAAGSATLSNP